MPTPRTATATGARTASPRSAVIDQLKKDHQQIKKAYRDFQKLKPHEDHEACQALVLRAIDELELHTTLEEELLYPAAHAALEDPSPIDQAEVEHEAMHALIDRLRGMSADEEKFAARFTVLCEYVLHHLKEEEGGFFPKLDRAPLDWDGIAAQMDERRAELRAVLMGGRTDDGAPGVRRHVGGTAADEPVDESDDEETSDDGDTDSEPHPRGQSDDRDERDDLADRAERARSKRR